MMAADGRPRKNRERGWAAPLTPHFPLHTAGKYGTRYGASLRKESKKMEISQRARYTCTFCGKDSVKRTAVGIWECKACRKTVAGGAWTVSTTAAATVRRWVAIRRAGGFAHAVDADVVIRTSLQHDEASPRAGRGIIAPFRDLQEDQNAKNPCARAVFSAGVSALGRHPLSRSDCVTFPLVVSPGASLQGRVPSTKMRNCRF